MAMGGTQEWAFVVDRNVTYPRLTCNTQEWAVPVYPTATFPGSTGGLQEWAVGMYRHVTFLEMIGSVFLLVSSVSSHVFRRALLKLQTVCPIYSGPCRVQRISSSARPVPWPQVCSNESNTLYQSRSEGKAPHMDQRASRQVQL